ncbi:hypothetical protein DLJ46_32295, partial [Micromonospora globispora]
MTGYAQLWAADPASWAATGAAWRGLTGPVRRRAGDLAARATTLRPRWSGGAAGAADGRLTDLRAEVTSVLPA